MNRLNYLVVILFIFLFASCSENNQTKQIGPRGAIENNIFSDDLYGLKLTIPEVWEVDDTSSYDQNTILRLNRNDYTNFEWRVEPLLPAQHFDDFFNERYHLVKSRSRLTSLLGVNAMSNIQKSIVEISGEAFHLITYNYKKEGVKEKLIRAQFYKQTGRDIFVMATSGKANTKDELGDAINEIDFASLPPADDSKVKIDRAYYQEGRKSTDDEGYYSLYEYDLKLPVPDQIGIERNLYADGWSTKIKINNQNHIIIREKVIDIELTYDQHINKAIKKLNESIGKNIIQLQSKKISGLEYDYMDVSKAEITQLMLESLKAEIVKEKGQQEYDTEYEKAMKEAKDAGSIVFMRPISNETFLNIESTFTDKKSREELMEIIEGIDALEI